MPELPEVEITRMKLLPIIGKVIANFWTDLSSKLITSLSVKELQKDIKDYSVGKLTRNGKVLFLHLKNSNKPSKILAFHQRMSGRFKIIKRIEIPTKHTRVAITFSDKSELHFIDPRKFGVVWYGTEKELMKNQYLQNLGPDALDIPLETFITQVKQFSGMVKPILLHQDIIAGIGNIVVDETLWASKIHPKTRLSTLTKTQLKSIHSALQQVLKASIKAKGSTLRDWKHPDEEKGTFVNYMNVYGKKGEKCTRCKTTIIRTIVGNRGTWICTKCQKISNQ
jgi:formamidopyrimidine-DNA glycosylase